MIEIGMLLLGIIIGITLALGRGMQIQARANKYQDR